MSKNTSQAPPTEGGQEGASQIQEAGPSANEETPAEPDAAASGEGAKPSEVAASKAEGSAAGNEERPPE